MQQQCDLRYELELPSDWQYMRSVLQHFGHDPQPRHVLKGPSLIARGLEILRHFSEPAAFGFVWEKTFETKSGLKLPVHRHLWAQAEPIRARYSREALAGGRDEWTARRVLLCALLIEARRKNENWEFKPEWGDYFFGSAYPTSANLGA